MKYAAVHRALEGLEDRNRERFEARREIRTRFAESLKRTSPARMLSEQENEACSQKTRSSLTEELVWKNPSSKY